MSTMTTSAGVTIGAALDGQLLLPGDAGYDEARSVWNALAPARRALDALRGWRDLLLAAPREATFTASVGSDGMVVVGFVWVGDPGPGRRLLPALRALGRPSAERVLELSYLDLQRMSDSVQKHALRRYSKGHYLRELPDGAGGVPGAGSSFR